ncbi:MAG TPA: lipocalin family protein [Chitinophagaceae bacterium]
MKKTFLLPLLLLVLGACEKNEIGLPVNKPATELLTQKKWILTGHGFDDNGNNMLDASENIIEDCQKDNSYQFNKNGTGESRDNAMSCGNPVNTDFDWRLLSDIELEIEFEKLHILELTEQELVLNPQAAGLVGKYLLVYKH